MLYAILCYNSEDFVGSWTKEQDDCVMTDLKAINEKLAKRGKLGPVARLGATKSAKTLRKDREPFHITDGPYAETKEQILGFWVVDCDTEEEALQTATELGYANPGGAFEVRPLMYYNPGCGLAESSAAATGSSH